MCSMRDMRSKFQISAAAETPPSHCQTDRQIGLAQLPLSRCMAHGPIPGARRFSVSANSGPLGAERSPGPSMRRRLRLGDAGTGRVKNTLGRALACLSRNGFHEGRSRGVSWGPRECTTLPNKSANKTSRKRSPASHGSLQRFSNSCQHGGTAWFKPLRCCTATQPRSI
jgi:hypothetical protein